MADNDAIRIQPVSGLEIPDLRCVVSPPVTHADGCVLRYVADSDGGLHAVSLDPGGRIECRATGLRLDIDPDNVAAAALTGDSLWCLCEDRAVHRIDLKSGACDKLGIRGTGLCRLTDDALAVLDDGMARIIDVDGSGRETSWQLGKSFDDPSSNVLITGTNASWMVSGCYGHVSVQPLQHLDHWPGYKPIGDPVIFSDGLVYDPIEVFAGSGPVVFASHGYGTGLVAIELTSMSARTFPKELGTGNYGGIRWVLPHPQERAAYVVTASHGWIWQQDGTIVKAGPPEMWPLVWVGSTILLGGDDALFVATLSNSLNTEAMD
jgi:hypothetical protein